MKKILFISHDGLTDPLGQSQVLPYVVSLSSKGFLFTIISAEKKKNFINESAGIQKICSEHNINWIPVRYHRTPPLVSTLFDLMVIHFRAKKIVRHEKTDIVHCRSYPPALIGLSLKKKSGCKFIFDMRGFWADERAEGKIWNLKNPFYFLIYKYFKRMEKKMLLSADHIITLTQRAKDEISSWRVKENNALPCTVVPCCADTNLFSAANIEAHDLTQLKKKFGMNNSDFVLSYLGALGTWYMIDEMLDFFKILHSVKPEAKFLFITSEKKEFILSKATNRGIDESKIIIVKAKRGEVPALLSVSDASVFFIKNVFSKKASSPTKMAEIMTMGIPIVCNAGIGDTDQIIAESNAGILVRNFDESSYMEAAKRLLAINDYNKNAVIEYAKKFLSLSFGTGLYKKVYDSL